MEWNTATSEIAMWQSREHQVIAESTDDGWFALCEIPADVPLLARAAFGNDATGYVQTQIPRGELRHLTWFVGSATRTYADSAAAGTTGATAALWRGDARLRGQVRDNAGQPVSDAHAFVWGTVADRTTGGHGTFALEGLPEGTQTLEVRAIGYVPSTRVVHLSATQPTNIDVTLGERVTKLPTVAIRAREGRSLLMQKFYERMRDAERGINRGYFITPEELEQRRAPLISNVFDGIPGIRVDRGKDSWKDPRTAVIRGPLFLPFQVHPVRCVMNVYLDGVQIVGGIGEASARIDNLVEAAHVAAIEVYPHPVSAPPQYQLLNGVCGVILIWTK